MKNAKITQRLIAALLASIMLIATLPLASAEEGVTQGIVAVTVDSDILMNAHEITAAMGIGWNLGNTFDSRGGTAGNVMSFETSWLGGTPDRATSLTLIKKVKELGFNSIRVPVTWSRAASPENNWDIWDEYIERIHEVVTWAYDEGLYIVINIHHDDNAIPLASGPVRQITDEVGRITDEDKAEAEFFIGRIWEQVSERFEAFGQRLIFEGMNEPRTVGSRMEWQGGTEHERDMINHLNQLFVDTVRASGGNNLNRMLMLPTYAASAETTTLRAFVKPEDVSANLLALSVHTYSPFTWAHDGTGRYNGRSSIEATFNRLATRSRALDMPVVLGEWGSVNNVNNVENTSAAVRARHARDYVYMAASRGMATIWWDNGDGRGRSVTSGSTHGFGLINRTYPHAPYYPQIVTGMLNGQLEANLEAQGEVVLVCDEFDPCKSCESCDFLGGRYGFGRITNNRANKEPVLVDALAILRYIVGLPSVIATNANARAAASITNPESGEPNINDALAILRFIIGMDSPLNAVYSSATTVVSREQAERLL